MVMRSPVCSYNEWDPLEEVVVGRLEGARIPSRHLTVTFNIPQRLMKIYKLIAGLPYPGFVVRPAQRELDEFIHILEAEGVTVRRPAVTDFSVTYKTPHWKSKGFCSACPRDGLLVVGDEIIETPMAWRSRYFEVDAYRSLLKEYTAKGAKWTTAPRPALVDALYNHDYRLPEAGGPIPFVVNEYEPVFDAADFVRCGRDLFGIRSNVTNESGIHWLRTHLGDGFRITLVETRCRQPMHIDSSFMPLAPGKGDREFLWIYRNVLGPIARAFRPEFILVSAGFDVAAGDPLGTMRVTPAGFSGLAATILGLARETAGGRALFILEGGYDPSRLAEGVRQTLLQAAGTGAEPFPHSGEAAEAGFLEEIGRIFEACAPFWELRCP